MENSSTLIIDNEAELINADLSKISNLTIRNTVIDLSTLELISSMTKLNSLAFLNCNFLDNNYPTLNSNKLIINSCDISEKNLYEMIGNVFELYLDNLEEIDLKYIRFLENIKVLSLNNTILYNEEYFLYLDNIERINLANSGEVDISLLLNCDKLVEVIIDDDIFADNSLIVNKLLSKGISVLNDFRESYGDVYV